MIKMLYPMEHCSAMARKELPAKQNSESVWFRLHAISRTGKAFRQKVVCGR